MLKVKTIHKYTSINQLRAFVEEFENKDHLISGLIYSHNLNLLFSEFKKCFKNIEAAGGLVFNSRNEFLGIHRSGLNDLPKGKLEHNETPEVGALREVKEECGLSQLEIKSKITDTFHTYHIKSNPVLKQTYWYRMITNDDDPLTPQVEENITDVFWVSPNSVESFTANTYRSIKEVLISAGLLSEE